jgi:hypothetical protein
MINRTGILLGLIVLTLQATSSTATVPLPAISPVAVNINPDLIPDKATEMAQLLFSRKLVQSQVSNLLDESLPQSMKNNSDFRIYEKEYPGLTDSVILAIKPAMLKAYDDKLALLWSNLSQLYRDNFTPSEIEQLHAFYASPVGMRLMSTVRSNINRDDIANTAVANVELNEKVITDIKIQASEAIRKSNSQISSADKMIIFRFENSAAGRKLVAFNPKAQRIQLEWDYYFTETQLAEFARVRGEAITEFMEKADAAKATAKSKVVS